MVLQMRSRKKPHLKVNLVAAFEVKPRDVAKQTCYKILNIETPRDWLFCLEK